MSLDIIPIMIIIGIVVSAATLLYLIYKGFIEPFLLLLISKRRLNDEAINIRNR